MNLKCLDRKDDAACDFNRKNITNNTLYILKMIL
jgi:hypothetical protein